MIFSSVLKIRLENLLKKAESSINLAAAIVDDQGKSLVRSNSFDDAWLAQKSKATLIFEELVCNGCSFQLAGKPLTGEFNKGRLLKIIKLIKENIDFLIFQEQEAQGLAQEVLEKYEELNLLYNLISELSLLFDEQKICHVTLKEAMRVIEVSSGAIFLKNDKSKKLQLVSHISQVDLDKILAPDILLEYVEKTVESGREILIEALSQTNLTKMSYLESGNSFSLLSLPIQGHDQILGSIVLLGKSGESTFESGDIKLAEAIAGYAGITIHSNRMIEQMRAAEALQHEMKLARQIQQSLLPKSLPETPFFQTDGICEPAADVGGDYFSVNKLNDFQWEFVIADVSGHGIGAAMTLASLRSILRSESRLRDNVKSIVKSANNLMCQDTEETGMYATLILACFDAKKKTLTYVNAGHQIPLLWKKAESRLIMLDTGGAPIGMFAEEDFQQKELQLESGDVLIMFTDGVTEARNQDGAQFGEDRLRNMIKNIAGDPAGRILKRILQAVKDFQNSDLQRDDITMVVMKVK